MRCWALGIPDLIIINNDAVMIWYDIFCDKYYINIIDIMGYEFQYLYYMCNYYILYILCTVHIINIHIYYKFAWSSELCIIYVHTVLL